MSKSDAVVKRESIQIRFHDSDMDFLFNWLVGLGSVVGLSHGELFAAVDGMTDGDPVGWRERFIGHGDSLVARASGGSGAQSAQDRMAAAFCYRAALNYIDPTGDHYQPVVERMDSQFLDGAMGLSVPLRAIEVPFEGQTLPGYLLEHDATPRPVVLMVGGGDTYRQDLWYFAGYPAWRRGYNAVMVDLPGQGVCPARGLTFRADMAAPISAVLDFAEGTLSSPPPRVTMFGVSGGGWMSAQAAASDSRIGAWVASTPITDMAELFRTEMGAALRTPGWLMRLAVSLKSAVNDSAELLYKKYAWQFGTSDFRAAFDGVLQQARPVDTATISCPCLFLVGEGEGEDLQRQATELAETLKSRGVNVTLRRFRSEEGGASHCQVDNLRLAHSVVFDWLDGVVSPRPPPTDPRLLAW